MYEIVRSQFGNTYLLKLRNPDTGEFVHILPEIGAALHQVCLACGTATYPLLWSPDDAEQFFGETLAQYRGALLMPFIDRIENGRYFFEGVEYRLPCNEPGRKNALHGFIHDKVFEVTEHYFDEEMASVVLCCQYQGGHPGYPFPFEVIVSYNLTREGIQCVTKVQNRATCSIPMGLGWHPYFATSGNLFDYEIKIPAVSSFRIRDNYINTGEDQIFNAENQFLAMENFDFNVYALRCESGEIQIILRNRRNGIDISLKCRGFPFLQLYAIAGKAVAMEPVTCVGNAFNNGVGLRVLPPNEVLTAAYSIALSGEMK